MIGASCEISLDGVTKRFGDTVALDGVTLELGEGLVAVTGCPGAGKSTLLHVVAGLKRPDEGRVTVAGVDVTGLDGDGRRRFLADHVVAVAASVGGAAGGGLAGGCRLVVADDVTAWLTDGEAAATAALLESLRAPGRVVLVATHDPVLRAVADRVVTLAGGRVIR